MIVDLFAGPGGWEEGLRLVAPELLPWVAGVDNDQWACATATAAGHQRTCADVADLDPRTMHSPLYGLMASPPCQGFSKAGHGKGREDYDSIHAAIGAIRDGEDADVIVKALHDACNDPRSSLVVQPLRWALDLRPAWVVLEQVPQVAAIWAAVADALRHHGWSAWSGCLDSEAYGVPQTRRRAILMAHRWRDVSPPAQRCSRYHSRKPQELDKGQPRWVSMAEALGWEGDRTRPRPMDAPAPTVAFGHADMAWVEQQVDGLPRIADQTGTPIDLDWPMKRPATAVAFGHSTLIQHPGATANRTNGATKSRNDGVRITIEEAATLQTFPPNYPWQGTRTKRYQQVGNAVPPVLAAAILNVVLP